MGSTSVFGPHPVLASGSFVLAGIAAGGLLTWYGRLVIAGLVFCFLGDVFGPGNFMLGLYVFLIAHLGLSAALFRAGSRRSPF